LPSASNSSTGGAALQHLYSGGFLLAPFSSSSSEAGRCRIQILPFGAVAIPATCPRIQFSGSGFGQNGSGWNVGGASALAGCCASAGAEMAAKTKGTIAKMRRMVASLLFLCAD
jgi:hypothetical protein